MNTAIKLVLIVAACLTMASATLAQGTTGTPGKHEKHKPLTAHSHASFSHVKQKHLSTGSASGKRQHKPLHSHGKTSKSRGHVTTQWGKNHSHEHSALKGKGTHGKTGSTAGSANKRNHHKNSTIVHAHLTPKTDAGSKDAAK